MALNYILSIIQFKTILNTSWVLSIEIDSLCILGWTLSLSPCLSLHIICMLYVLYVHVYLKYLESSILD